MELKKIVVASKNKGKIEEIKAIFHQVEIVSMAEIGIDLDIEESGRNFKENAQIKAEAIVKLCQLPTLADDSGLCVDELGGAPGIYSARFSGEGEEANRKLLLKRLEEVSNRKAHFECAVCLCMPDGKVIFGQGRTDGRILHEEIGTNGFGYDPLFYSDELKKSFGLASEEEKNSVSHRYKALVNLYEKL